MVPLAGTKVGGNLKENPVGAGEEAVTLVPLDPPKLKPEGTGRGDVFSTSLSNTKLSVVAKNGASLDAIFLMWSISNLGSFSVKFLWRNCISMSMTAV